MIFTLYVYKVKSQDYGASSNLNLNLNTPCPIPQSHLNLLTQIKEGQREKNTETPESFRHSSKHWYVCEHKR